MAAVRITEIGRLTHKVADKGGSNRGQSHKSGNSKRRRNDSQQLSVNIINHTATTQLPPFLNIKHVIHRISGWYIHMYRYVYLIMKSDVL